MSLRTESQEFRCSWVEDMPLRTLAFYFGVSLIAAVGGPREARAADAALTELTLLSSVTALQGPAARQQILAIGKVDGQQVDLTRQVQWRSETPDVVSVSAEGVARAQGDGDARITASSGGQTAHLTLKVSGTSEPYRPTFERDVMPLLSRAGCNAGACHGKARGQNGFQLSILAFDPDSDFAAIALEARGRRVFPAAPTQSLLLQKGTAAAVARGGPTDRPGRRGHGDHRAAGSSSECRGPRVKLPSSTGSVSSLPDRLMTAGSLQQIVVTAHFSDGSAQDVTHLSAFQSNESGIVEVTTEGQLKAGTDSGRGSHHRPIPRQVCHQRGDHPLAGYRGRQPLCRPAPSELY